jgi:hypothetical protein
VSKKSIPSLDEAMKLLSSWKASSRQIGLVWVISGAEFGALGVKGSIADADAEESRVRIISNPGFAAISLKGAAVNPPVSRLPAETASAIMDLQGGAAPGASSQIMEFDLPNGSILLIWDIAE